ncbi:MAG TPA: DUF6048 family protein [Cyclobacteriaceae bacterium]|nr:DUF6048 family protein [Cyclobacteriaceae bacterium]
MIGISAAAQNVAPPTEPPPEQTVPTKKVVDTVKYSFIPSGLRIGTDVLSLIKAATSRDYRGWEMNADVDVYKYYLAVDYGSWGKTFSSTERQYENSGNYFRVGFDVNLLKKDPDHNMIFLGARYASSTFWERLHTSITDPIYGSINDVTYYNPNVSAHWVEAVTGIRIKIWNGLWLGYTARLKFGLSTSNSPEMVPAEVPGYGYNNGQTWGFNYQVFWRIPFKSDQSVTPKK